MKSRSVNACLRLVKAEATHKTAALIRASLYKTAFDSKNDRLADALNVTERTDGRKLCSNGHKSKPSRESEREFRWPDRILGRRQERSTQDVRRLPDGTFVKFS